MFEIIAEFVKEEENVIIWDADVRGINLRVNIQKWRIPEPFPNKISIKLYFPEENLQNSKIIPRNQIEEKLELKKESICLKTNNFREDAQIIRLDPIIDPKNREIDSFHIPISIIKDRSFDNISIIIEWVFDEVSDTHLYGDLDFITGNSENIYGFAFNIVGDTSRIKGDISNIWGEISNISGEVSNLKGDVSNIRGDVSNFEGDVTGLEGDVSEIKGDVTGLEGDVSEIKGDVTGLEGDVSDIKGDVTDIKGYVTDVVVDVTNYKGQIDLIVIEKKFLDIKNKFNWKILGFNKLLNSEDLDFIYDKLKTKSPDSLLRIYEIVKRIIIFIYEKEFQPAEKENLNIWLKKLNRKRIFPKEIFFYINSLQFTGESILNEQKEFSNDEWNSIFDITVPIFINVLKWFYNNILLKDEKINEENFTKSDENFKDFELPESLQEVKIDEFIFNTLYLKQFQITGLFNSFDHVIDFDLNNGMKIIFGPNGIGKTTIIEIISNFSEGKIVEILKNKFREIKFVFSSNSNDNNDEYIMKIIKTEVDKKHTITCELKFLEKEESFSYIFNEIDEDFIQILFNISLLYQSPEKWSESRKIKLRTIKAFYPEYYEKVLSDIKIIEHIYWMIKNFNVYYIPAQRLKLTDRKLNQFAYKFENLTRDPIVEIKALFNNIIKDKAIYLKRHFQIIDQGEKELFIGILNGFFYDKVINIDPENGFTMHRKYSDEKIPLDALSSGEKNLIIIFFNCLFETKKDSLLLIDEPEISLHAAWQLKFLKTILKIVQFKDLKAIISTHSPQIVSNHIDSLQELAVDE